MSLRGQDAPQKQTKHTIIMDSTNQIFRQIKELEDLVAEISSSSRPEEIEDVEKQPMSSLSDFLNSEAEKLDSAASRIIEAVSKIRSLLF